MVGSWGKTGAKGGKWVRRFGEMNRANVDNGRLLAVDTPFALKARAPGGTLIELDLDGDGAPVAQRARDLALPGLSRFEAVNGTVQAYSDRGGEPHGVYVGATRYAPAARFDQHKAGIRAAGSVLKRGLEVLTGPVLHLQRIPSGQAAEIEETLAEALRAEGLLVRGGH